VAKGFDTLGHAVLRVFLDVVEHRRLRSSSGNRGIIWARAGFAGHGVPARTATAARIGEIDERSRSFEGMRRGTVRIANAGDASPGITFCAES
jgi:hypothetical protein